MNRFAFVLIVAFAVVTLDQATKWIVQTRMELFQSIPVIDSFFHFTYVRNSGGAFGFLHDARPALRLPFFITISIAAIAALLYFVRQIESHQYLLLFALGGILGGALGNLIDRMASGTVVDFFDVHWRTWYWPTFNVADSFISIGVAILLAHSLFGGNAQQNPDG